MSRIPILGRGKISGIQIYMLTRIHRRLQSVHRKDFNKITLHVFRCSLSFSEKLSYHRLVFFR